MVFQPGQSGNPTGKPKQKPFTDALNMALRDDANGPERKLTKMDLVASALLSKAIDGDVPAIKEVADRIQGKVPQALTNDEDDQGNLAELLIRVVKST
jgi:hypothetical protein